MLRITRVLLRCGACGSQTTSKIKVRSFANLTGVSAMEPTLSSLGLAGWTPPGMIQSSLEFLHVSCALPWWGAVAVGTLAVRLTLFPLVVTTQRNSARMHNNMPEMMKLQMRMNEARATGDNREGLRAAKELSDFMREKNVNPLKSLLPPLAQAPFFISIFMGLRGMAELPVESLKYGGLFWFENLTVPDPYYALPLMTSVTMFCVIQLGADTGKLPDNMKFMKNVLRIFPFAVFPVTCQFPAAVLCYWVTTNLISLVQVGVLKIPAVREYLNIPKFVTHPPSENRFNPLQQMTAGESWDNIKLSKDVEERQLFEQFLRERERLRESKTKKNE